uniref:COX2_CUA domain-containing protein n=1 Tax=Onchocerca volvulus TaxID=6282 RepID=A0A8R1U3T0_ONCVO
MAGLGFWLIQYQGRMFRQSELTLKVIDSGKLCFDSFMKSLDDLSAGDFRLFYVDNPCVLPVDVNVACDYFDNPLNLLHLWLILIGFSSWLISYYLKKGI